MKENNIKEREEKINYNLELEKALEKIKETNAKMVCIQLPDGLKPKAKEIQDFLNQKTNAEILIWGGSCYGACDFPLEVEKIGIDLLISFGHSEWRWQ